MGYTLTLPVSTVIIGCKTVEQLEENIAIAKNFKPLPKAEMARLEGLTARLRRRRRSGSRSRRRRRDPSRTTRTWTDARKKQEARSAH